MLTRPRTGALLHGNTRLPGKDPHDPSTVDARNGTRALLVLGLLLLSSAGAAARQDQAGEEVPVTIKELDVSGAIREFKGFRERLGKYREEIGQGRKVAQETAQILEDLPSRDMPETELPALSDPLLRPR